MTADKGMDQYDDDERDGLIELQSMDEIPQFANEEEEDAFWGTHFLNPRLWRGRGLRPGSVAQAIAERRRRRQAQVPERRAGR